MQWMMRVNRFCIGPLQKDLLIVLLSFWRMEAVDQ